MPEKEKIEAPEVEKDKVETPEAVTPEKMLPQSQVDKLMAKQRSDHAKELAATRLEFDTYKKATEEKATKAEEEAKAKVEKLREGLPEGIVALLDKLTAVEQLEWLSDPANIIEKKTIHALPEAREGERRTPSLGTVV